MLHFDGISDYLLGLWEDSSTIQEDEKQYAFILQE